MKDSKIVFITLAVALIVGAGSFFGGMKYQQAKGAAFVRNGQFAQGMRNGEKLQIANGGPMRGFRPVVGEIIASDEKSITVKLADGSSKIVLISESTKINKASEAGKEDLKSSEQVAVFGTENADGSVTANTVQLNPEQPVVVKETE